MKNLTTILLALTAFLTVSVSAQRNVKTANDGFGLLSSPSFPRYLPGDQISFPYGTTSGDGLGGTFTLTQSALTPDGTNILADLRAGFYWVRAQTYASGVGGGADNLGNHTASQNLDLDDFSIVNGGAMSADSLIMRDQGGDSSAWTLRENIANEFELLYGGSPRIASDGSGNLLFPSYVNSRSDSDAENLLFTDATGELKSLRPPVSPSEGQLLYVDTGGVLRFGTISSVTGTGNAPAAFTQDPVTPASSTSLQATWTTAADALFYNVYTNATSAGPFTSAQLAATVSAPTVTYTLSGLDPGQQVCFFVEAHGSGGITFQSNVAQCATTDTSCIPPTAVSDLIVNAPSVSGQLSLAWTDTNEDDYELRYGTASGGPYTNILALNQDDESAVVTGLADGTTYYFVLAAIETTDGPCTSLSNQANGTTGLCSPPAAPTGVVVTGILPDSVSLSWNNVASTEEAYEVWLGTVDGGPYSFLQSFAANSTSGTVGGLTQSTTYYGIVRARENTFGPCYGDSSQFTFTTPTDAQTYYVDPSYTGGGSDGSAGAPWTFIDTAEFPTINAARATGPVTIYFSARQATADLEEAQWTDDLNIRLADEDPGFQLTICGDKFYNPNDSGGATWIAYAGAHRSYGNRIRMQGDAADHTLRNDIRIEGFKLEPLDKGMSIAGNNFIGRRLEFVGGSQTDGPMVYFVPTSASESSAYSVPMTNVLLEDIVVSDPYGEAVYIGGSTDGTVAHTNITIDGLVIDNAGSTNGEPDGIDVKGGIDNLVVRNFEIRNLPNIAANVRAIVCQGFASAGSAYRQIFENGWIHDCYVSDGAITISDTWGVPDRNAYRNIVIDNIQPNLNGGARGLGVVIRPSLRTMDLHNLTIYESTERAIEAQSGSRVDIRNCAMSTIAASSGAFNISAGVVTATGSNNLVDSTTGAGTVNGAMSAPGTFTPGTAFLNPAAGGPANFAPSSGASPLVDAGTSLVSSGFSEDYFGTSRPIGANWDVGAVEGF